MNRRDIHLIEGGGGVDVDWILAFPSWVSSSLLACETFRECASTNL